MEKTIRMHKSISRAKLFLGGAAVATLIISLVNVQSAFAMITSTLDLGDSGSEVTELQTYLATDATLYPSGLVTGYFGQLTKAGVERFQTEQGIVSSGTPATTGYGRVGPKTQAAINANLSGGGNQNGDVAAPLLRAITVNTDTNGASVTWTASEASYGKVYYSTSPLVVSNTFDSTGTFSGEPVISGTLAQYDGVARVTHTVNINNLMSNTTYYYAIVVFDGSKNVNLSHPSSNFRTK